MKVRELIRDITLLLLVIGMVYLIIFKKCPSFTLPEGCCELHNQERTTRVIYKDTGSIKLVPEYITINDVKYIDTGSVKIIYRDRVDTFVKDAFDYFKIRTYNNKFGDDYLDVNYKAKVYGELLDIQFDYAVVADPFEPIRKQAKVLPLYLTLDYQFGNDRDLGLGLEYIHKQRFGFEYQYDFVNGNHRVGAKTRLGKWFK